MTKVNSKMTVLITGATGGIGFSLALEYAEEGALLILLGRDEEKLKTVSFECEKRGAEVKVYTLDLSSIDASLLVSNEITKAYNIDLLISNAGTTNCTQNGEIERWGKIESLITINLLGALAISHAVIQSMQERGSGHVAYVSSLGAYYGMPLTPAYCASKAGLKAYAEAMRGLLASQSISVTLVAPGFVKTSLSDQFLGSKPFMISADEAARRIKRGLDRKKRVIAFPFPLMLGMRLLAFLPVGLSDFILARLKY